MSDEGRHVALVIGASAEARSTARDISDSLESWGFAISELDADADIVARLAELGPDIVFNVAGRIGDGRLQGACDLLGLAHTHSGLAASALAADRHLAKMVFKSAGIPVTDHILVDRAEAASTHVLPPPYLVKARHAGTGGKAIVVRSAEDPPPRALLEADWAGSEEVMVERFLPGMTLSAFVMGDVMIGMAAVTDANRNNDPETLIPASISSKIYEDGTRLALKAHGVFGCRGVTALRFRVNDRQGLAEPVAIDLDTQPDLGRTSPLARIAAHAGHEFDELLRWIIGDASCRTGN